MQIIPNVPCRYVELLEDIPIEFILLHKLIENKDYKKYYIENKDNGKYKILDNSAFEMGESLDDDLLIRWAEKINASEIIIPDVYGDKEKTLIRAKKFLKICPEKYKLMAVPQGKTLTERKECLDQMCGMPRVTTIGYNKLWDRGCITNTFFNKHLDSKENHLLGVNSLSDWALFSNSDCFRSADSRILSKLITGNDDPWEEILTEEQISILKRLIREVRKW